MTVLLAEMTREQIQTLAPTAIAVLPTAAVEQHGPHLPILTDTILCGTIAHQAANRMPTGISTVVAPTLCYGSSHHHRPFPGVLSLTSDTYIATVRLLLEGLVLSGFRKLVLLNGHGGNTDSNRVVAMDFVHRFGQNVALAVASYWDIVRPDIVEQEILPSEQIPGHAGCFETALVMAIRPDLVDQAALDKTKDSSMPRRSPTAVFKGGIAHRHGVWAAGPGFTDNPAAATPELGQTLLEIAISATAQFLVEFEQIGYHAGHP